MNAEVTVIIPVYNAGTTVRTCLESIQRQTVREFVVCVVDDGSSDDSADICEEIAACDSRVRVIRKENGGPSSARNCGIEQVETPYFVCVDSDDFVEPYYLEVLLGAAKQFPGFDGIWTGFRTFGDAAAEQKDIYIYSEREKYSFFQKSDFLELYEAWLLQMPFPKLYRTDIVRKNALRMDETVTVGEDMMFNLDYLEVANNGIVFVNEAPYHYYRGGGTSLDHKFQPNLLADVQKSDQKVEQCVVRWCSDIAERQKFYNFSFYRYERVLRNTFHPDNPASMHEKLRLNNEILKSDRFREILRSIDIYVNPLYLWAYKSGNYRNVLFVDRLVRFKHKIHGG